MKLNKILIFVLILAYISCTCSNISSPEIGIIDIEGGRSIIDPTASKSSCINREFSDLEKQADAYKCCYYNIDCTIKVDKLDPEDREDIDNTRFKQQYCTPLTKDFYDSLQNFKNSDLDSLFDCKAFQLECDSKSFSFSSPSSSSSPYLGLSIVFLILFLLY